MSYEIINKLFLELSHVATATTERELAIFMKLKELRKAVEPFVLLVNESEGRVPTEKLSLAQWHALTLAFQTTESPARS